MGLFKKQRDPFSQRAAALNNQIAALEAQIRELSEQAPQPASPPSPARSSPASSSPISKAQPSPPQPAPPQPRLRSTTRPIGPVPAASTPFQEPIFEHVDQERLHQPTETAAAEPENDLGTRRNDLSSLWERMKNHFRGPATTNPKLVSYLAAGSIQGLRPLRYEKRVARNRFIVLFILLALALWGLSVMIFRH